MWIGKLILMAFSPANGYGNEQFCMRWVRTCKYFRFKIIFHFSDCFLLSIPKKSLKKLLQIPKKSISVQFDKMAAQLNILWLCGRYPSCNTVTISMQYHFCLKQKPRKKHRTKYCLFKFKSNVKCKFALYSVCYPRQIRLKRRE